MATPRKKPPFEIIRFQRKNGITHGVYGRCKVLTGPLVEHFGKAQFMFYMHSDLQSAVEPQIFLFPSDRNGMHEAIGSCSPIAFQEDFMIIQGAN